MSLVPPEDARPRPPWSLVDRCRSFPVLAAMRERVLVFDGAMGTMLHAAGVSPCDYLGYENCIEILNETRPDIVASIHDAYFRAGADIVETNTLGSMPVGLKEYGLADRGRQLSFAAARIAKRVAADHSTAARPRWVAGSVGPTTKMPSLGHIAFRDQLASYQAQIEGLLEGGIDAVIVETQFDILNLKSAVIASRRAMREVRREVPIFAQITIETTGTMLVGTDVAAALPLLEALEIDMVGLNCATGPDRMEEHVQYLGRWASRFVSVQPNAGLPRNVDGVARFDLPPAVLADHLERFVREYGVNAVGGCCGTKPEHIRAVAERVAGVAPKLQRESQPAQISSLYGAVTLSQDPPPLLIAEQTNATGSKTFRDLLLRDDWDGMVEMAKEAAAEGAHAMDVCTSYVGRDERRDMTKLLERLATQATLPIMIDTTQPDVMEKALGLLGGRAILNSIHLQDGEAKAERVLSLARDHGACVVALTIDEEGMARTASRKEAIARRIHRLAVEKHGLSPDALLVDALTFPIGSGEEESRRAAIETLEGIAAIKRALPGARTLLGVSNVSFGLHPQPRRILNSVFLAEAVERGLDAAIVSPRKIMPLSAMDEEELQLARDLIYDRRQGRHDPLLRFVERFQNAGPGFQPAASESDVPIEEQIRRAVIEGKKSVIHSLLEEALKSRSALDIMNTVLLDAMRSVGDLFGSGQMQLPFVLQAAETMKAAVSYLQPHVDRVRGADKGVVVLATVKGDVHDIGKNLVDIILSNNGYTVRNLGIRVPVDRIIESAEEERADVIGISGLLVKSTVVMKENLQIMRERGCSIPVICGGAALTRAYVERDLQDAYGMGEVFYGCDAFTGLRIINELCGHEKERKLTGPGRKRHLARSDQDGASPAARDAYSRPNVTPAAIVPRPPFWGSRVVAAAELPLREVFPYVNRRALFRGQWQYRRGRRNEAEYRRYVSSVVEPKFRSWCQRAIDGALLAPAVAYGYFPCAADRNEIVVYRPEEPAARREWIRIRFPRQPDGERLCIADFFRPVESGELDVLAAQVVTVGAVASRHAKELFESDRYDDYLHFHGLAVETAEALAEMWHRRVRAELGFGDADAKTIEQLFRQGYQGSRYSFGYPACPALEDQRHVFTLLGPERIGITLTEAHELVPEQSTTALICHHPEARYFNA